MNLNKSGLQFSVLSINEGHIPNCIIGAESSKTYICSSYLRNSLELRRQSLPFERRPRPLNLEETETDGVEGEGLIMVAGNGTDRPVGRLVTGRLSV